MANIKRNEATHHVKVPEEKSQRKLHCPWCFCYHHCKQFSLTLLCIRWLQSSCLSWQSAIPHAWFGFEPIWDMRILMHWVAWSLLRITFPVLQFLWILLCKQRFQIHLAEFVSCIRLHWRIASLLSDLYPSLSGTFLYSPQHCLLPWGQRVMTLVVWNEIFLKMCGIFYFLHRGLLTGFQMLAGLCNYHEPMQLLRASIGARKCAKGDSSFLVAWHWLEATFVSPF